MFFRIVAIWFLTCGVAFAADITNPPPSTPPVVCNIIATSGSVTCSDGNVHANNGTFTSFIDAYGRSPLYYEVWAKGPGGPGAGGGTTPGNGTVSVNDTTFGTLTAAKGAIASGLTGGAAGACANASISYPAQAGGAGPNGFTFAAGGIGGGQGYALQAANTPPTPPANSGFGGPGGASGATASPGGGGGQGANCYLIQNSPSATYSYTVGPASVGGSLGTGGAAGAPGAAGGIVVRVNFQ